MNILTREELRTLVLAAVEYLQPIYQEANTYPHLLGKGIQGNPETLNAQELHTRAWSIVEPLFATEREAAEIGYRQLEGTESERASNSLEQVVPAAHAGRVKTLFVALGTQKWGTFDPQTGTVELTRSSDPHAEDLLDLAAIHTLLNDGAVYVVSPAEVPGGASLAAVYRY